MPRSNPPRRGKGPTPPRSATSAPGIPPEIAHLLDGASLSDLHRMLDRVMSHSPFEAAPPLPSGRRAPREEVVTYRIRVDLDGARPPIWRRLEVASDLTLDRVHDILQVAMGWTDSHLHEFAGGDSPADRLAEHYRPQDSLDNDLPGVEESTVRIDEVLADPGDRLFYSYDFGDDWAHTLRLEAVAPRRSGEPPAVCTGGARACPPEDCGGIWGYHDLLEALAEPNGEHSAELLQWVGPHFDPARFDVHDVNSALVDRTQGQQRRDSVLASVDPTSLLGSQLSRMDPVPDELVEALAAACTPVTDPDNDTKTAMVSAHSRLLDLVGDTGITLTQAGYLPPAIVQALADVLHLDEIWIGKNNREAQTYPVLEFRESAQRLGLLRKAHNKLTLTKAAIRARNDIDALWRLIAEGLPLGLPTRGPEARAAGDAGLLLLVGTAAGMSRADRRELVAEGLDVLGWRAGPFAALSERDVQELLGPTEAVLEHVGAIPRPRHRDPAADRPASAAGVAFARAALRL